MGYTSFPNDQYNNRAVTLAEYEQTAIAMGLSGMLYYNGSRPVIGDSTGLQVKLRADNGAWIRGTRFNNSTETIIPIGANTSGKTRIDLVVLRKRRTESAAGANDQHTVAPVVIQGVPADNPTPPAPVRSTSSSENAYDLTLAEVVVPHNASTIADSQVACRAYWVNGTGYTGREEWAFPPVEPGVIFRANDTGVTYIGTSVGTWERLYNKTGWVPVTEGASKAGWSFVNFAVARSGDVVVMAMFIKRTGAALSRTASQFFGPVPSQFKPNRTVDGVAYVINPVHAVQATAQEDGQIRIVADGVQGVNTGGSIACNMTWLAD